MGTEAVAIAAGLMHAGASPGAALAFLIAGPATNAAALTTVWRILGRRAAVLYLATVAFSAVACGLLLDWLMPWAADWLPGAAAEVHLHEEGGAWLHVWAALLVLTVITVGVSYLDMKHVTVLTALLIATVKGTLVLLYFMHLRFEKPIYAVMVLVVLGTYAIFVGLTFSDYAYR